MSSVTTINTLTTTEIVKVFQLVQNTLPVFLSLPELIISTAVISYQFNYNCLIPFSKDTLKISKFRTFNFLKKRKTKEVESNT